MTASAVAVKSVVRSVIVELSYVFATIYNDAARSFIPSCIRNRQVVLFPAGRIKDRSVMNQTSPPTQTVTKSKHVRHPRRNSPAASANIVSNQIEARLAATPCTAKKTNSSADRNWRFMPGWKSGGAAG
jgi:hypothetical protein